MPQADPLTSVALVEWEDVDELGPRWAALAATTTLAGFSDSYWADDDGWHHLDGGGGVVHLTLLAHGRAVMCGVDQELSATADPEQPVDLLSAAPDWVRDLLDPWPEDLRIDRPGFVYWLDDDDWRRVPYPGDPGEPVPDGASAIGRFMFDDDQAAQELLDWATQWIWDAGGVEWEGDEPELVAAAHTLIDDLREPGQERQAVVAFLGVLAPGGVVADLDAAAEAAADFTDVLDDD